MRDKQSGIDRTYVDLGILLKEEVRQSRFGGSDYSIETELDEDLWKKKQEEEENQFGGFEDQIDQKLVSELSVSELSRFIREMG